MKIEVSAKGKRNQYEAHGIYDGKGLIVLKGSRIAPTMVGKMNPIIIELRNRKDTVNEEYILQRDVQFRSASTAASFITGNISNGMRVWKLEDGKKLGSLGNSDNL